MKNQASKMRLISMFYLTVFASALLLSGLMGSQRELFPMAKKSTVLLFAAQQDSIPPMKGIDIPAENPGTESDVSDADKKHDLIPFEFDFSFSSLIQWFFRLPSKAFTEANSPHSSIFREPVWLSIRNIRI